VDAAVDGAPPDGVAAGAGVEEGVDVGSDRPQPVVTSVNMTANVEPRIFGCGIGTSEKR
jgi:hypothetical protein